MLNNYNNFNSENNNENVKGFSQTGLLLVKEKQDSLEYHLYNREKPSSFDVNETLELYYINKKPIHISIENETGYKLSEDGKLTKGKVNGIIKYYLNSDNAVLDLEEILFFLTGIKTTIKINTLHTDNDVVEFGGTNLNESRES